MNIQQTLFDDLGNPLGKVTTDSVTDRTTFEPRDGNQSIAKRTWCSLAACRRAVVGSAGRLTRSRTSS
jgi:hypothetical protein